MDKDRLAESLGLDASTSLGWPLPLHLLMKLPLDISGGTKK